jgi:hypothetical protein
LFEEDALTIFAALDYVQRLTGKKDAAQARHGCRPYRRTRNNSTLTAIFLKRRDG